MNEEEFIERIFYGDITTRSLGGAKKVFRHTYRELMKAVRMAFDRPDSLYRELRSNIYVFSGAKTYQQVKDISGLITDGTGLRPYAQFREMAKEKFKLYNESYLKTEYETAVGQAQSAVKWRQVSKDKVTFPYLQRKAVMDANTSQECRILNGIVARQDDPFWRTRSPLTHFNCRCILTAIDKYEDVQLSSPGEIKAAMDNTDHINPLFKGNPGIDKVIFNETHPYFDIEPKELTYIKRVFK